MAEILDNSVFGEINENEINNNSGNKPEKPNYLNMVLLYPLFLINRLLTVHFVCCVLFAAIFYMTLIPIDFNRLKIDLIGFNFMGNKHVKFTLFFGACVMVVSIILLINYIF